MRKNSKINKIAKDYKKDIPEYNDDEILEILKKRKYYQEEAVNIALEEALNRGLIQTEQDLFEEDFRPEPLKFRIFPKIEDEKNKNKIRKSIARSTLITGIIPLIWGFLLINAEKNIEGGIFLLAGICWIYFASGLIRKYNQKILNTLFVITALSFIVVLYELFTMRTKQFMDFFIVAVLYGLLTYGLLFINKMK